jgi:hypothetical protein
LNMELEDKILVGEVLTKVLDEQTMGLDDPFADELPMFIYRALTVQMRMKKFYSSENNPPQMLAQLNLMERIIKRLLDLQNKKCY